MDARQPDDLFVDAGTFFSKSEAGIALKPNVSASNTAGVNVSTRSSLRNKVNMLDSSSSVQTRHRSQRFVAIENANDDTNGLIGAVMSPTTSSGVAAKREATRFPSVMFGSKASAAAAQKSTSSPLPGPKSATSSYVSTRRTVNKDEEEDSAASYPHKLPSASYQQLPFNRSSVASELYQSATSHTPSSSDDLSALSNAVKALKTSSLATNATNEGVSSTAAAPAYVPLPKPAARIPAKQVESSLDSLQQRVARITLAHTPAALHKKAVVVASPKIERYSPVGMRATAAAPVVAASTTPMKQQEESHNTSPRVQPLPTTPGAPANTPASPLTRTLAETQQLRQQYTTSSHGPSPAQIEAALAAKYQFTNQEEQEETKKEEEHRPSGLQIARLDTLQNIPSDEVAVLMASPLPSIPNTATFPSSIAPNTANFDARTEYDGDEDVVMGDATPGGESVALATTVPRRASMNAFSSEQGNQNNSLNNSGGSSAGGSSGVRASSRFKIEALRQGVTPLRVRQHRASFSPSNAGVNVEIESARKSVFGGVAESLSMLQQQKENNNETSSPTMSDNPLALQPAAHIPPAVPQQHAINSPSASSNSAISNNPIFAGTPSHPTPPSVTARRPSLGMAAATGLRTPSTGGASAASEGIKLAEQLHAAAEKLQTPVLAGTPFAVDTKTSPAASNDEDATFQFQGDVQALLQALDANTPQQESNKPSTPIANFTAGMPTARALAAASTEERPKPVARRCSSFSPSNNGAAILDLAGFNADGERTSHGQGTPLLAPRTTTTTGMVTSGSKGTTRFAPSASATEIAALRQHIADLESECKEATSLLSSYQGTIAELQDRHSAAIIKLQAENSILKSESERLRSDRAQIHSQFEVLYREKYAPLKTEAAALRRGADALRTRLTAEGENAQRIVQLEAELSVSQAATAAAKKGADAFKAEAEAAREAARVAEQRAADATSRIEELERKWASKFAAESSRAEQALAAKESEISKWKDKHAAMARQYDDAVHRAHLAQAARERKAAEVSRKEEEICTLDVQLRQYEHTLAQYRAENEKFAGLKDHYKARIRALEEELAAKEAEKQALANVCNELSLKGN